jgi:hypothetical protein
MGIIKSRSIIRARTGYAAGSEYDSEMLRRCRGVLARTEPPGKAGVQRAKLDDEIRCHKQSTEGEGQVSGKPHPLPENRILIECAAASIRKPVLVDCRQLRPADRENSAVSRELAAHRTIAQAPVRRDGGGPSPGQASPRELLARVLEFRQHFETFFCAAWQHKLFVDKFQAIVRDRHQMAAHAEKAADRQHRGPFHQSSRGGRRSYR